MDSSYKEGALSLNGRCILLHLPVCTHKNYTLKENFEIETFIKDDVKRTNGGIMVHLVYCDDKEKVLEKIIEGSKSMIIRGAAGRKIPHSRVFEGEALYFMKKGTKKITATAIVKSVQNYVKLTEEEILQTLKQNQPKLNLSEKQQQRWQKKCMCLVEFEQVSKIEPLEFDHQGNMDDWLILENIGNIVVGTSIPYNYEKSKF